MKKLVILGGVTADTMTSATLRTSRATSLLSTGPGRDRETIERSEINADDFWDGTPIHPNT